MTCLIKFLYYINFIAKKRGIMRFKFAIIVLLVVVTPIVAGSVFSECNAVPQTDQVSITWITSSENNVTAFVILRSNNSENYVTLKRINAKGPGASYEYIDDNVMFKGSNVLFYKVRALNKNNEMVEESSMIVQTQTTSMHQTWGAIKAFFK